MVSVVWVLGAAVGLVGQFVAGIVIGIRRIVTSTVLVDIMIMMTVHAYVHHHHGQKARFER